MTFGTVKAYCTPVGARLLRNSIGRTYHNGLRTNMSPFMLHVNRRHDADGTRSAGRGFGTGGALENGGVSKQQKLQEVIDQYKKAGSGPVDRTALKTALEGGSSAETASPPGTKSVFEETMTFPTQFMIKIVAQNDPTFVADMLNVIAQCLDKNKPQNFPHSVKETAGGKYLSLTVDPLFRSSEQLYAVYAAIGTDKRVKMTL